jgi:LPXTG-motif cell wall-anchored protein
MKKTLAIALTAAMAISAIGASVSAASVDVKTGVEAWEQTATVKLADDDISGSDVLTQSSAVKNKKLGKLSSNNIAKFIGWSTEKQTGYAATDATAKYNENTTVADLVSDSVVDATKKENTLYPVFRYYTSEKEREDTLNGDGDINSDDKRAKALEEADKANGATDNTKKDDGGVETKQASVIGDTKNPNGLTPEDASDPFTDVERQHLLKICGYDNENGIIAYVYDVSAPKGLLNGKSARATLPVKTTSGMKATLYHIVDAYSAKKVTGLNVGSKDVSFWANSFSPYVLVLTPSDSVAGTSTGNPGTGDFSAVPVALLAAAALGATGFVAYKKRKAE